MLGANKLGPQRRMDYYLGRIICYLMSKIRFHPKPTVVNRVNIIRLSAIGDAVLTLPMIKKLKEHNPNIHIKVLCGKDNYDIYSGLDFIDEIEIVDVKKPLSLIPQVIKLWWNKADWTIDTSQSSYFGTILAVLSGRVNSGFYNSGMTDSRHHLIDHIAINHENDHMINNFTRLAVPTNMHLQLVKPYTDYTPRTKEKFIAIHPCGKVSYRAWDKKKFAEVINYLTRHYKYRIFLVGSPDEKPLVDELMLLIKDKKKVLNVAGGTNIKEFIGLCKSMKLFIANDGGLMHIAASMNVPTLGIFGYETPLRYRPYNKKSKYVYAGLKCSPCNQTQHYKWNMCQNHDCLNKIEAKEVITLAKSMLGKLP